jgi:hypothetical protein
MVNVLTAALLFTAISPCWAQETVQSGVPRRPAASGEGSPIRWTDLVVDPDGYAWLQAWTPFRDPDLVMFIISIETGHAARSEIRPEAVAEVTDGRHGRSIRTTPTQN